MSRVANTPINIPAGVEVKKVDNSNLTVTAGKNSLSHRLHDTVSMDVKDNVITFSWDDADKKSNVYAGTSRAVVNNMVTGVAKGFEKKLTLVGVGYRGQVKGKVLSLTLGFSHPISYDIPEGISIEMPSQTEITVKGHDIQKVGQVSAEIRAYRPPEPYKGKGVRYNDEHVVRKDAKKK